MIEQLNFLDFFHLVDTLTWKYLKKIQGVRWEGFM